uniref:Uncharacterized protein n=1 Tax=Ciona intestinalis TaxID=7719 RepID=H2XUN2_CIOIN
MAMQFGQNISFILYNWMDLIFICYIFIAPDPYNISLHKNCPTL